MRHDQRGADGRFRDRDSARAHAEYMRSIIERSRQTKRDFGHALSGRRDDPLNGMTPDTSVSADGGAQGPEPFAVPGETRRREQDERARAFIASLTPAEDEWETLGLSFGR